MKMTSKTLLFASIFLFAACSGSNGKKEENGSDENGDEKSEKKAKKEKKEKAHEHSHEHGEIREDYSGVFKAGAPDVNVEDLGEDGAMDVASLPEKMDGKDSLEVKLKGKVTEVCQKKGCWMKMDLGEEKEGLRVRFKDYSFFVPKKSAGSEAVLQGWAYYDTLSVKQLRHYAMEAENKSEEEVKEITEPKTQLAFKASKVMLRREEEAEKEAKEEG